jgi:hypothetical protein
MIHASTPYHTCTKIHKVLEIPVIVTEQNPKGESILVILSDIKSPKNKGFGNTIPDIDLPSLGPLLVATIAKELYSMMTPEVRAILHKRPHIKSVVLFGVEVSLPYNDWLISHIARFSHKFACYNLLWTSSRRGMTCM